LVCHDVNVISLTYGHAVIIGELTL
jgi:hypothetical protein